MEGCSFVLVGDHLEGMNRRAFNDIKHPNQASKSNFIYTFVNWARVYVEDHTLSLLDFIDWLNVR